MASAASASSPQNRPASQGSAVDRVVDAIRALIRDRALKVGDPLPTEAALAIRFSASRNTVREAIRLLKAYGLVASRQKSGAVITDRRQDAMMDAYSFGFEISADSFRDIQGFRRLVEVNLADLLFDKITPEALAELEQINLDMNRSEDAGTAAGHDFRFHSMLIALTGNRTLREVYGIMTPVIRRIMEIGKTQQRAMQITYAKHQEIIAALRTRDRLAYTYHMSSHLDAGLQFLPAAGDGEPDARRSDASPPRSQA